MAPTGQHAYKSHQQHARQHCSRVGFTPLLPPSLVSPSLRRPLEEAQSSSTILHIYYIESCYNTQVKIPSQWTPYPFFFWFKKSDFFGQHKI